METRPAASVLYVRLKKQVVIRRGEPILLAQVAQILTEPELESRLARLVLHRPTEQDGNLILVDMMMVARAVRKEAPGIQIEYFGDPHTLVEVVDRVKKPMPLFVLLVWLLLFVGSGLAIMNFHADVSMPEVHRRIVELLTGKRLEHPYLLQIPYSVGLGLGMVLFFNHIFRRKFNEEPSPLEVEMYLYQQNMNQYIITEEYAKQHAGKGEGPRDGQPGP